MALDRPEAVARAQDDDEPPREHPIDLALDGRQALRRDVLEHAVAGDELELPVGEQHRGRVGDVMNADQVRQPVALGVQLRQLDVHGVDVERGHLGAQGREHDRRPAEVAAKLEHLLARTDVKRSS